MSHPDEKAPFQAHRRYYLAIKLAVLAAAVLFALHYFSTVPLTP